MADPSACYLCNELCYIGRSIGRPGFITNDGLICCVPCSDLMLFFDTDVSNGSDGSDGSDSTGTRGMDAARTPLPIVSKSKLFCPKCNISFEIKCPECDFNPLTIPSKGLKKSRKKRRNNLSRHPHS